MFNIKKRGLIFLYLSTTVSSLLYASISGTVYKDFDMNGEMNGGDAPVIGASIQAICDDGNTYKTTTNTNGGYTLATSSGVKCRVEADVSGAGVGSGTNFMGSAPLVDIAVDGTTHDISTGSPATYCQANPDVILVALPGYYTKGENSKGGGRETPSGLGAIFKVTTPPIGTFNDNGKINNNTRKILATWDEVGAVWGAAWKKGTKDLFVAAALKRYVPLKDESSPDKVAESAGKIYKIHFDSNGSYTLSDFAVIDNVLTNDAKTKLSNRDYGYNQDLDIMNYTGRMGLGDIDINEDETKLYTVNMKTKELVTIDLATGNQSSIQLPNPYGGNCDSDNVRPWAVKARGGKVYIGSVCEDKISTGDSSDKNDKAGVGAVIQEYNGAIIRTIAQTNSLRYLKPKSYSPKKGETNSWYIYKSWNDGGATPILTDIEFTNRGDLVLGYTNRAALNRTESLGGDIRKMCLNADGTYTDESSDAQTTNCASHEVKYEQEDKNHETYYEFYVGDYYGGDLGAGGHPETASGALAQAPGAPNIMVGMVDATDWYQPGAIGLYSNITGDKIAAQAVINRDKVVDNGEREPYGSKAGGMGDIELLCDPAPIEIGNYVWMDLNKDGIQDPNEPPIKDVNVTLSCGDPAVEYGSVLTDKNGHYYFGGPDNANLVAGKMIASELNCTLSIDKADVNNKPASTKNPNSDANDTIDNDAEDDGNGHNIITFTTNVANDHSLDFGIEPAIGCASGILFQDDGSSDGVLDASDHRAPAGIKLIATDAYGNKYEAETNSSGEYRFDSLVAGDVTVKIDTTDTDIPDGAKWDFGSKKLSIGDGTSTCTEQNYPYDLPSPVNQNPADVAECFEPTSITWDNANVGTQTVWDNPSVGESKTIATSGGESVNVTMKIINDNNGKYNPDGTGSNGHGAFAGPYLTLYLGDQNSSGDGNWQNSDGQGCDAHGYGLEAGNSYQLEVTFSEPVVLDNWRIRDVDSGNVRNSESDWEWQDGISVEGFDANGNAVSVETKIGNSGAGLIVDSNGIVHTDKNSYNAGGGDFTTGDGSSADSTNGHIVLTSNFQPITKLVITHSAGPDIPCQTRSALAMAGLAVCKPLHISGKIFDDKDGTDQCNCGNNNEIDNETITEIDGKPLYVCAINDDTGKVVDAQQVKSDGTYDLSRGMDPSSAYQLMLTTQVCTIGKNAPSATLSEGWKYEGETYTISPDGDIDGVVDIDFAASGSPTSATDMNFAINKVPEAHGYARTPELNPGGTNQVPFVNDDNKTTADFISDTEEGQDIKIKISRFSGGTVYYDGAPVTNGQEISNPDFSKFTVDPDDGDAVASFAFVAIDGACRASKEVVFAAPFTTLEIGGNVFHDSTADGKVNGEGNASSCNGTTPLYVNLVDSNNTVLSSKVLNPDGSYRFYYIDGVNADTNYTLALSTTEGVVGGVVPSVGLESGCVTLDGENIESLHPGENDGSPDGKIAVEVKEDNIDEINFAIGFKSILNPPPPPAPIVPTPEPEVEASDDTPPTKGCLGDRVWIDSNRDGIQDAHEVGVKDTDVTLYLQDGVTIVKTTKTDNNGEYLFSDLDGGEYVVGFGNLPQNYLVTLKDQGGDDSIDSDVNPDTLKTDKFALVPNKVCKTSIDMGIYENVSIHVSDDEVEANTKGPKTVIDVLNNDEVAEGTIYIIDNNGDEVQSLVVPREGTWEVKDGQIIFTAEDGFNGVPTPIRYIVKSQNGGVSNIAEVRITTPCTCSEYSESSVATMNIWSILLLVFASSLFGLLFLREELEVK
jgi:hypothetical protein